MRYQPVTFLFASGAKIVAHVIVPAGIAGTSGQRRFQCTDGQLTIYTHELAAEHWAPPIDIPEAKAAPSSAIDPEDEER